MNHERILAILYDLALAIGGELYVAPLLTHTLQRFMYHTTFPCGMVLLFPNGGNGGDNTVTAHLVQAIGDHRLSEHVGESIKVPRALFYGPAELAAINGQLQGIPSREGFYTVALRLPIPEVGVILLLAPEAPHSDVPFSEVFKPILSNLAKAIHLCRLNESHTEALRADRDLALSQSERFRSALDRSDDLIFLIDPITLHFIDFNQHVVDALGYSAEELYGMGPYDLADDLTQDGVRDYFLRAQQSKEQSSELITLCRAKNGRLFPIEVRASVLEQESGWLIIAVARDITERREAEQTLERERGRALVTLSSIGDAVITTDSEGRIEYLNPSAVALTGWSLVDARGMAVDDVCLLTNEITGKRTRTPVATVLAEDRIVGQSNHVVLLSRDGRETAIEDNAAPIRDRDGAIVGTVMVMRDVSKTREMADRLTWQAAHDALTGLINRREFENHLTLALQNARERGNQHVLLYLDLDQFKVVNDTCGHMAGDELLKQLSDILRREIRENDILARLGGDEFGLLLHSCPLAKAEAIGNKVRHAINKFRFAWQMRTFEIGVSIGLAVMDGMSESVAAVLSAADMACYAAKEGGRNRIHIYEPNDQELAQRRGEMQRVTEIAEALNERRFELFFQLIAPVGNTCVPHHEVLLRMRGNDGMVMGPGSFIPAAERYNLMPAIDRFVIRELFATQAKYIRERYEHLKERVQPGSAVCVFAINLSGTSLGDEQLLDYIISQLAHHSIPPQAICFEITETAAIANLSKASKLIRELRHHGCRFSLDDFGSGLSSFGYLKNLPVDFLKIDGSFVKDIVDDPIDYAMVEAINHIGHVMGIHTIAEFVENEAILEKLKILGIDYAQGYAVGKPMPVGSIILSIESDQHACETRASGAGAA